MKRGGKSSEIYPAPKKSVCTEGGKHSTAQQIIGAANDDDDDRMSKGRITNSRHLSLTAWVISDDCTGHLFGRRALQASIYPMLADFNSADLRTVYSFCTVTG